jgi:hypothetical protein
MILALFFCTLFAAAPKPEVTDYAVVATNKALKDRLREIAELSNEGIIFYLIAAGESYLELATIEDPKSLDFDTFFRGSCIVIEHQKNV